jgi:hypothetical protein
MRHAGFCINEKLKKKKFKKSLLKNAQKSIILTAI